MRQVTQRRPARAGFTLVELLVVIAIIAFLAALLVAFYPSLSSQTAEANAAVELQGWLNTARQKAIRNQAPYGLRLWIQANLQVVECSYVEQPDDFIGTIDPSNPGAAPSITVTNTTASFNGADLSGGNPTLPAAQWPVQPGDFLEVTGSGLMHRITQLTSTTTLTLNTAPPFSVTGAINWRILRAPRVVGEETLALPEGVIVDLNTNSTYGNPLPPNTGQYVDVLFAPSGALLSVPQSANNFVALWVRQPDTATGNGANVGNVFAGTPSVIAVFTQTGLVGAYPPISGTTPYSDIR